MTSAPLWHMSAHQKVQESFVHHTDMIKMHNAHIVVIVTVCAVIITGGDSGGSSKASIYVIVCSQFLVWK